MKPALLNVRCHVHSRSVLSCVFVFDLFVLASSRMTSAVVGGNQTSQQPSSATFKGFSGFHFTPLDARNILAVRDMITVDGTSAAENEEKFKVRSSPAVCCDAAFRAETRHVSNPSQTHFGRFSMARAA